jgi:membrane protein DedA with SNARE-associated domain
MHRACLYHVNDSELLIMNVPLSELLSNIAVIVVIFVSSILLVFVLKSVGLIGATPSAGMMSAKHSRDVAWPHSTIGSMTLVVYMYIADWIYYFTGDPKIYQKWLPFPVFGKKHKEQV